MSSTEKQRKIADHFWLAADGSAVEDIEKAAGYRYQEEVTGGRMDYIVPGILVGTVQGMFALFGAKTKAINWSSQLRTENDGRLDISALQAKFAKVRDGAWPEREGGGFRYDLDKLADALVAVLTKKKKPANRDKIRAAMEAGGSIGGKSLDAKDYVKTVASVDGVKGEYDRLMGRSTDIASIGDDFG